MATRLLRLNGLVTVRFFRWEQRDWLLICSVALNTTVANILLFVYDAGEQIQSLYGYGQDGVSIVRSDDRGQTWLITDLVEYSDVSGTSILWSRVKTPNCSFSFRSPQNVLRVWESAPPVMRIRWWAAFQVGCSCRAATHFGLPRFEVFGHNNRAER